MKSLRVIRTYGKRIQADNAKSYLTPCGIRSAIFADDAGGACSYSFRAHDTRLIVSEKDVQNARHPLKN